MKPIIHVITTSRTACGGLDDAVLHAAASLDAVSVTQTEDSFSVIADPDRQGRRRNSHRGARHQNLYGHYHADALAG
jgi:hypothetical protein